MLKATSAVALSTPEKGMPVPLVDRIAGLTITMYDIVTNVVRPPMISCLSERSRRILHSISTEARGEDGFEVRLGARAGEIEIGLAQRIDQRADDVRAADGDAAGGADVSAEPIQEDDLPVEEHD